MEELWSILERTQVAVMPRCRLPWTLLPRGKGPVRDPEIRNKPRSHPRSQIENPEEARSVAAARATENLRRDKKGKVREQVDLFVVAQKAQVVLCYHKKGRQKENL